MALAEILTGAQLAAGLFSTFKGSKTASAERERFKREQLAALAPTAEEQTIRGQLLSEAQRGIAGEIDPGLERFLERRRALRSVERGRGADVRRGAQARGLTRAGFGADDPVRAALASRLDLEEARATDEEALEREATLLSERGRARAGGQGLLRDYAGTLQGDRLRRAAALGALGPETGGAELAAGGGALLGEGAANFSEMLRTARPESAIGRSDAAINRFLEQLLKGRG